MQARTKLRRSQPQFEDYHLPENALTPYYRPVVTSVAQKHRVRVDDRELILKSHSGVLCEVIIVGHLT